jgi:prepilin-type N-terminal cleavage/methylation domain-containing protein
MFHILTSSRVKRRNNDDQTGFTLAEVLITLLIIGVVASITVPNLINDSQEAEHIASLKKAFSEFSVTTKRIISDNGGTFIGVLANDSDHTGLRNAYAQYLSYTKSCNDARDEGCWHPLSTNGGTWKALGGTQTDTYNSNSGLILNDGMLVNFIAFSQNCTRSLAYYAKPIICGWIIVDVNGFKKPNVIGKDVFYFQIIPDRLEPIGSQDFSLHSCSSDGVMCTASKLQQ